ncbi:hypothetical protein Tco_0173460 [Tanacetum coccineum]|uniref:Uncharacterized protein n=1 Tax=Tanacetum coccineum TaxID=301880 RepID=A0ABQ4ZKA6_9ASTR
MYPVRGFTPDFTFSIGWLGKFKEDIGIKISGVLERVGFCECKLEQSELEGGEALKNSEFDQWKLGYRNCNGCRRCSDSPKVENCCTVVDDEENYIEKRLLEFNKMIVDGRR